MSVVLGVLARGNVPVRRSNQVIVDGALALATHEGPLDKRAFHSEVVSWCREAPFLPCGFGTPLSEETADHLFHRAGDLLAQLDALEGTAEYVLAAEQLPGTLEESGRAYLRSRARKLDAHSGLMARMERSCLDWTPQARVVGAEERIYAAFAVKRCDVVDLGFFAASLKEAYCETHSVHLTGPWPLYSFGASCVGRPS